MTDRQLRDEVMTLFLAGHETTANALGWTWFLLGQNPEVEQRLVSELNTILGDRSPNVADLPKLTYTEAVVKESLRLYPPAYAFSRRVLADATIGGFHIPAGSAVFMSQWVATATRAGSTIPSSSARSGGLARSPKGTAGVRLFPIRRRPTRLHRQHIRTCLESILADCSHRPAAAGSSSSRRKKSDPGHRSLCVPPEAFPPWFIGAEAFRPLPSRKTPSVLWRKRYNRVQYQHTAMPIGTDEIFKDVLRG